jgi:cytochrome c553
LVPVRHSQLSEVAPSSPEAPIMKPTSLKITVLATILYGSSAWTGNAESLAIENCNWCHGASAQGYAPAPRLAGQSDKYIENQLISFGNHTRDNPFSRQYMWGAAANLSPQMAHYLAAYFSTVPPKAADDGFRELAAAGATIYQDECRGRWGDSSFGRVVVLLFEKAARAMERRIQFVCKIPNAANCEQLVA